MSALDKFFSAWGETDPAARHAMIAQVVDDTTVYSDPRSGDRLIGLAAISEYVAMFSANAPGWTATVSTSDAINGYVRAKVIFGGQGPDGSPMEQAGTYFAEVDGDTLKVLAGFVGA